MGITKTELYTCDNKNCGYVSPNAYYFRIFSGDVKIGSHTLIEVNTYSVVLCIDCVCDMLKIGTDGDDVSVNDPELAYLHYDYEEKGEEGA